jgi:acetyl esterase/lipase
VVVFFYGGNWVAGEREDYAFVGRALASRGIVAVIADYGCIPK